MHDHSQHQQSQQETQDSKLWLKRVAIGTALITGALILSPYVLPLAGIGETELAEEAMLAMHGTGVGNGLAGALNGVLNAIPLVGQTLASGGLVTAAASAATGLGGLLLGRYIDKKDDGTHSIRWGKLLASVALATSAFIALPSLLTGVSVGVVYLTAAFAGVEAASTAVAYMAATLGSVSAMNAGMTGLAGAASALPHMLTCVAPAVSGVLSLGLLGKDGDEPAAPALSSTSSVTNDGTLNLRMETIPATAQQGVPCRVRLHLSHADTGAPVLPEEIAPVHNEIIHMFAVDQSLRDYHHIHPVYTGQPGVYETTFTPQSNYYFNSWTDVKLKNAPGSHRLKTAIAGQQDRGSSAYIAPSSEASVAGITATMKAHPPLQQGVTSSVDVTFTDRNGHPVTDLEPVVGAFIHMTGFDKNSQTMMHPHPEGEHHVQSGDRGGPAFHFEITPEMSGPVQFYLQVKRNGTEIFIPMGQVIKAPSLMSEKMMARNHAAAHSSGYGTGI